MGLLLPLMVLFILLSVFSGELWQSVGTLPAWKLGIALLFVLGLGVLIALSRIQSVVKGIKNPEPPPLDELVAKAFKLLPLVGDSELMAEQDRLSQELIWRHIDYMWVNVNKVARQALLRHVVARLSASVLLLGILLWAYLLILFTLLFPASVITQFLSDPPEGSPTVVLIKVSLFMATFIVAYFIVQALTEERMQEEMFADLRDRLQDWERVLILYEVCRTPTYQLWTNISLHPSISMAELEIVVPCGKTDSEVEKSCQHAADIAR